MSHTINKQYQFPEFTQKVMSAYTNFENPRTQELIQTLIRKVHEYIEEVKLQKTEWEDIWQLLAEMAKYTGSERNEFLLLADVIGVSQLIEMMNHQTAPHSVGEALLGPFYRANAPERKQGASIASADTQGEKVLIRGRVFDDQGQPICHAVLDVWQAATNGLYENQDPDQADMNLRGQFKTDAEGNYALRALMPTPYPVPIDGPVGNLLRVANRHPYRPAHIHFIVSAPNFETLVTQVFVAEDALIETDVVFTASENMIGEFKKTQEGIELKYDFQLLPGVSTHPKAPIP